MQRVAVATSSARRFQRKAANAGVMRQVEIALDDPSCANAQQPETWSPFQDFAAPLDADISTINATLHRQHRAVEFHLAQPTFQTQSLSRGQFRAEISAWPNK